MRFFNSKPFNPKEGDIYRELIPKAPPGTMYIGLSGHEEQHGRQYRYMNGEWVRISGFSDWNERLVEQRDKFINDILYG